jgi:hypothetical protein
MRVTVAWLFATLQILNEPSNKKPVTEQVDVAVSLEACIRKALFSNLGWTPAILIRVSCSRLMSR